MTRRSLLLPSLLAVVALGAAALPPAASATAASPSAAASGGWHDPSRNSGALSRELLAAVRAVDFAGVVDFDSGVSPAPQVQYSPHVDVAVIALNRRGRATAAANILVSRDFPKGHIVRLNQDLGTRGVVYRAWDIDRWNDLTPAEFASTPYPAGSALNPRARGVDFMSPYPASTFKLLVAVGILRLVDTGRLSLDQQTVNQAPGAACIEGGTLPDAGAQPTVGAALSDMLTFSDNTATCLLLQQLHAAGKLDPYRNRLNGFFARLGMPTLQINGTDPTTGATWSPGSISMGGMDTARLLLLLQGSRLGRGSGRVAPRDVLSRPTRSLMLELLSQQGFNEVLSTTNWCGADYPVQGIPARVPDRWIDPTDGTVTVDGVPYGQDVRPCNETAQVSFAHKTGLTYNYGSDAGIVTALPGQDGRRYIVTIFANLGYRYSDPSQAGSADLPCFTSGVCYTEKFAQLGKSIDDLLRASS